jgi:hypothetical protein
MKFLSSHPTGDHAQPHKGVSRGSIVVLAALAPVIGLLVVAPPAASTSTHAVHKSYVCKYVGTPGVDERLQTGKNPIWVDNHSLTGKLNSVVKVGDTFSDKHVTSVVIVANTAKLRPEPTTAACPVPVGPTKVTAVAPTATAPTCTADGALVVPTDTAAVSYTSKPKGTGPGTYDVTAKAAKGYVLVGASAWTITVLPKLTGEVCAPPVVVTAVDPVVVASTTCGVEGSYTVPATTGVSYLLAGKAVAAGKHDGPASGTMTAVALTGYQLSNPTWSYALSVAAAKPCAGTVVAVPVNPTVTPSTTCEVQGTYVIPTTTGLSYLLGGKAVAAGSHVGPASGTVTAVPDEGYALSDPTWSFALSLPAADICEVDAPTTTTPTETTNALPKTGSPVPAVATIGALALLLGFALLAAGTRRLPETLS